MGWKDMKISEADVVDPWKTGECVRKFNLEYLLKVDGTVNMPCILCNAPTDCPGRKLVKI